MRRRGGAASVAAAGAIAACACLLAACSASVEAGAPTSTTLGPSSPPSADPTIPPASPPPPSPATTPTLAQATAPPVPLASSLPPAPPLPPAGSSPPAPTVASAQPTAGVSASATRLPGVIRTGPAPNGRKVVYLTFDDGPTRFTPQVLDVLRGYNAKATFFVIGGQVRTREATVRRARAEGHLVQNHTWNHPLLTPLRYAQVTRQLVLTNRAIRAAGLPQPACMRPPYGAFDTTVRQASRATGQRVVNWSLDSRDWTKPGARSIAGRVVGTVRPGSIVLLHDGGGDRSQTVAALRVILRTLGRQGYSFATLPVCR